jgi:glutamine---fructose-6-phosphate transaminase (isomerizing)
VIAVADDDDEEIERFVDHVLRVPAVPEPLCAVVASVPLQLLAYRIGRLRGMDVDQPRHLGKSVR